MSDEAVCTMRAQLMAGLQEGLIHAIECLAQGAPGAAKPVLERLSHTIATFSEAILPMRLGLLREIDYSLRFLSDFGNPDRIRIAGIGACRANNRLNAGKGNAGNPLALPTPLLENDFFGVEVGGGGVGQPGGTAAR